MKRIYIDGTRVTVSKPGYDAEFPPSVSYDYLSLDSRLSNIKPLIIAAVPGYVFGNKIYYGQTFDHAPAVDVFFWRDITFLGETYAGVTRYGVYNDNGALSVDRSSYFTLHDTDGFTLTDRYVNTRSPVFSGSWTVYYLAWKIR